MILSRRAALAGGVALGGGLLAGCERIATNETARAILFRGEDMHRGLQRALTDRAALAPTFSPADLSPIFRANGTRDPGTPDYRRHLDERFANWRLAVGGLVERPLAIPLAVLRAMPQRAQITRHDCVEGWSAIGKWQGPQLATILRAAGLKPAARYLKFTCADLYGGRPYYESIDLIDAFHPQTILAWALNDRVLPVRNGAPVRLRVERQLGYKHAKYVMAIDAVASLSEIGLGRGGYWQDYVNYDWYAGI